MFATFMLALWIGKATPLPLSPDSAVVCLTLGLLLIYFELNRPGGVIPGAAGLLAMLLAIAALIRLPIGLAGSVLIIAASCLFLLNLVWKTHWMLAVAATLTLIFGFLNLAGKPNGPQVHLVTAIGCGLILGAGTSLLTHLARRARANKGLDLEGARTQRPGVLKS